ncbi:AMP-binding protein [Orrella sp. JC864]|uniref:AMP-binding protein n=1 Tax=Orrella sp. JC864 TaxID=3120298 RepID=UPI003008F612
MTTQRPWLAHYPEGVPHEVSPQRYRSLVDLLDQACEKHARLPACDTLGTAVTYRQMDGYSRSVAAWLQSLKLPADARVALMMPNVPAYLACLVGVLRAGHVLVNVNPLYKPRELQQQLQDSGARVIFILESFAHTLQAVQDRGELEHVVVVSPGDLLGLAKGAVVNFVARHVKRLVPRWELPGARRLGEVLERGALLPYHRPSPDLDDLAVLQYTGGTTGTPKGAMLTHRNLVVNVLQVEAVAQPALKDLRGQQLTLLGALPLYHIFALTVCGLYGFHAGMCQVLIMNPRDLRSIVKAWRKRPINIFPGVNTLFNALVHDAGFQSLDFSSLRLTFGGGMAVQRPVAERWLQLTGRPLIEGYGLSETSPVATVNPTTATEYSGSIGLPLPSTDLAILDEQGRPLPLGERGEIGIRGPQVMAGYWNKEKETQESMTADGYFKTGDIGVMDERGYTRIVDRKKDMILVSGFNVYPSEIEEVVAEHPGVLECAAIGVPDEHSTEVVKLFVVRKDPGLTEQALMDFCRERLTGYKRPRQVEFRKELPKSNVGKILRRELRPAEDGQSAGGGGDAAAGPDKDGPGKDGPGKDGLKPAA